MMNLSCADLVRRPGRHRSGCHAGRLPRRRQCQPLAGSRRYAPAEPSRCAAHHPGLAAGRFPRLARSRSAARLSRMPGAQHGTGEGERTPRHDPLDGAGGRRCRRSELRPSSSSRTCLDFTRRTAFPHWKRCLDTLGYTLSEQVLNDADLGVPQHRRRLFIVGVHKNIGTEPVIVPPGTAPHVAASTILDPEADNWSPILKQGRAAATVARMENASTPLRRTFSGPVLRLGVGQDRTQPRRSDRDRYHPGPLLPRRGQPPADAHRPRVPPCPGFPVGLSRAQRPPARRTAHRQRGPAGDGEVGLRDRESVSGGELTCCALLCSEC